MSYEVVYVILNFQNGLVFWSLIPDDDGNLWRLYFGSINGVGKLNIETG